MQVDGVAASVPSECPANCWLLVYFYPGTATGRTSGLRAHALARGSVTKEPLYSLHCSRYKEQEQKKTPAKALRLKQGPGEGKWRFAGAWMCCGMGVCPTAMHTKIRHKRGRITACFYLRPTTGVLRDRDWRDFETVYCRIQIGEYQASCRHQHYTSFS